MLCPVHKLHASGHPEKVTIQRYPALDEVAWLSSEFIADSMEQIVAKTSAKHVISR